jgi:hypothetical protein
MWQLKTYAKKSVDVGTLDVFRFFNLTMSVAQVPELYDSNQPVV